MTTRVTTVADIVKAVSAGRMGNRAAIEALQLRNYDELVETVHLNGYTMAGHRPAAKRAASCGSVRKASSRIASAFRLCMARLLDRRRDAAAGAAANEDVKRCLMACGGETEPV
jgi:hypothetical protein